MKSKTCAVIILIILILGICLLMASCADKKEAARPRPLPLLPTWPGSAEGKPNFHYGLPAAYWIWYDDGGWHLRVTTAGARHNFHGTVEAPAGFIKNFRTARLMVGKDRIREDASKDYDNNSGGFLISVQEGTKVRVEGERVIRFDFWSDEDIYGFDWRSPSGCNVFNIYIDGVNRPQRVFVGETTYNPPEGIFDACR